MYPRLIDSIKPLLLAQIGWFWPGAVHFFRTVCFGLDKTDSSFVCFTLRLTWIKRWSVERTPSTHWWSWWGRLFEPPNGSASHGSVRRIQSQIWTSSKQEKHFASFRRCYTVWEQFWIAETNIGVLTWLTRLQTWYRQEPIHVPKDGFSW